MNASEKNFRLNETLKQYFGFTSFRPLQEEIIHDALAGRDVFALLPTGGGKSLCYQLPALIKSGLTVVVSPLIALMKDQVQSMDTTGIPATFLNSSLTTEEFQTRLKNLHRGEYRLLYVAPERLMLPHFLSEIKQWPLALIAIDESHCISEWGHDFRPEYRKLSELRNIFPQTPMMALTATATARVQKDILQQLRLENPNVYIASFNRPNLTYRVTPKQDPENQTLKFIESYKDQSGIIYCYSRKNTESIAEFLTDEGISALPYHAGLTPQQRSKNQDAFIKDKVKVICATIAFGMGINKPNVRFVLHYDLPKNIEGYYQETGRAGRDSLPSECLLLFSAGDAVKQSRFIEEKTDPSERQNAKKQLQQIIHYSESRGCRRKILLHYFGEDFTQENCGSCDNCISPRETYEATIVTQKFLSCVYRIREKSGFSVGMKHVVEVLTGATTEKIQRWKHQELSTYGIGKELKRNEWSIIGRELIRLGFLEQSAERFNTLELTQEGHQALVGRRSIFLTRQPDMKDSKAASKNESTFDEILFERLRELRRRLADERAVPPYIIFSDATLRQMCQDYPTTPQEFSRISGVGEKKFREFCQPFVQAIKLHLERNPRMNLS